MTGTDSRMTTIPLFRSLCQKCDAARGITAMQSSKRTNGVTLQTGSDNGSWPPARARDGEPRKKRNATTAAALREVFLLQAFTIAASRLSPEVERRSSTG